MRPHTSRAFVVAAVVGACAVGCPTVDAPVSDAGDPETFRHDALILGVATTAEVTRGERFSFDGDVRAATDDDLAAGAAVAAAGHGVDSLHAPTAAAETFAIDDPTVGTTWLFSVLRVSADGERTILYQPTAGHLSGAFTSSGFDLDVSLTVRDGQGLVFAGAELGFAAPEGVPFTIAAEDDAAGDADETACGHRRERALRFSCADDGTDALVRIGASAPLCGLVFTNHSSWRVESDWRCTDTVNPSVWSAIR